MRTWTQTQGLSIYLSIYLVIFRARSKYNLVSQEGQTLNGTLAYYRMCMCGREVSLDEMC